MPSKKKIEAGKAKEEGGGGGGGVKAKRKGQDCCVTIKPKNYFEILLSQYMPEVRKLVFCIWIRRPQSVRPVNNFVLTLIS